MKCQAIFLDRDGVINKKRNDYVKNAEEFEILDGVGEAIKILKKKYLVIIITNQSAIGRNLLTQSEFERINNKFKKYLKQFSTNIDSIYYCPHLPEDDCFCRKPKPGLLQQAQIDYNIDMKNSFMIGDSETDTQAANATNCKSLFLKTNGSLLNLVKQNFDLFH